MSAENITDCVCDDVVSDIVESFTENDDILGCCVSVFVIVMLTDAVDVLPAESLTVKVYVCVVVPNEKLP